MKYLHIFIIFVIIFFLTGCEKKYKPVIVMGSILEHPIECLKLNPANMDKNFISILDRLYTFQNTCPYTLSLSYKKDIVCNSTYNTQAKSLGSFPKSFLKYEVRKGLGVKYSYYLDLSHNVDNATIEESFEMVLNNLNLH